MTQLVWKVLTTLFEDGAAAARLVPCRSQAAPPHPRAPPEPLGSLPWPQELASGRHKPEDVAPCTTRHAVAGAEPKKEGAAGVLPTRKIALGVPVALAKERSD